MTTQFTKADVDKHMERIRQDMLQSTGRVEMICSAHTYLQINQGRDVQIDRLAASSDRRKRKRAVTLALKRWK